MVMRELIAQWVLMHEHPFTIVEEERLNNMLKYGIPGWSRVSRNTCKNDYAKVYEMEKQKLKTLLKGVRRISLTIDLWNSDNQKLEYMVLTGHWIDDNWKLNKWVFNFFRLPTPKGGVQIADAIYKYLAEWEIEDKVQTISVDNASSNDVAIRALKQNFTITRRIIDKIHESVVYINGSEGRLKVFAEIVQQLRLPCRKLILDCKTRWNSTYDMLEIAIKFKEVFPRYKERDKGYKHCPDKEDWVKVEKVCEILRVFSTMTNIISGSNYPTSNVLLRYKIRVIEFSFPKMYSDVEARANATTVWDTLYEVYGEYANDYEFETIEPNKSQLDIYLSKTCYKCQGDSENFDALDWWKANALKYPILSRMARDILVIPITTVASEATFSVGSRVIDTYRSSLSPETVEMLLCGADWCRILNGVKKGITIQKEPVEIQLPEV
ncbi:zinc finger BED domain-containing protein RICESLEEPER 2-like [Pistacia vera]|uniref:zinc finger BED domain-containing protein RICESLEEPER 2-like n=1 Tax=Pistacia vera TaxID=55513 RepID=UPI001262CA3C|nr:zinc finger BED domain-containing protein RICESLEEPER 2-like [Pistacia vera]